MKHLLFISTLFITHLLLAQEPTVLKLRYEGSQEPITHAQVTLGDVLASPSDDNDGSYTLVLESSGRMLLTVVTLENYTLERMVDVNAGKTNRIWLQNPAYVLDEQVVNDNSGKYDGRMASIDMTSIHVGHVAWKVDPEKNGGNTATNNAREIFAPIPGIHVWESDGGGLQLGVGGRGFSPNRTAHFNTRQNGYDMSADALGYPESYYSPPMAMVDRVDIIRGASSLQFGPQFGGLLNFKLKAPADKVLEASTTETIGSWGFFNSLTSLSGKSKAWEYLAYYQYKRGNGWRPNEDYDQMQGHAHLRYHFTEKLSIALEYTRMSYLARQAGGLTDGQFEMDPRASYRDKNWFRVRWNLAALDLRWQVGKHGLFNLKTFGLVASRSALGILERPDRLDMGGPRDLIHGDFINGGVEARWLQRYKIGKHHSAFLFGARVYRGETSNEQGQASDGVDADFRFLNPEHLEGSSYVYPSNNQAAFAMNMFTFGKWRLAPGVRVERIETSSAGYYRNIQLHPLNPLDTLLDQTIETSQHRTRWVGLGGLGVTFMAKEGHQFYGNFSMNFRPINFSDLRIQNPTFRVDPDITDETGFSSEMGWHGNVGTQLEFDASVYLIHYNDKIGEVLTRNDTGAVQVYRLRTNVSNAIHTGAEFGMNWHPWARSKERDSLPWDITISGNVGYVYARYVQSEESSFQGNQVELAPPLVARTGVRFEWKNLSTGLKWSYTQGHYSDASNAESDASGIAGYIPSYWVMDFDASYELKRFLKFGLSINNLTDNRYFTRRSTGYPGPGIIPSGGIFIQGSVTFTVGTKN